MKVFIATRSFGEHNAEPLTLLTANGLEVRRNELSEALAEEELVERADGCVGVIAGTEPYTREVLTKLKKLKVISRCGVGLDSIDLEAARAMGIVVGYTPECPTQAVAELTMGLILNLIRHMESSSVQLKSGIWKKQMGFLVGELTFGIIGVGRIGKRVAELLRAFDATVLGCDIRPDFAWAESNNVTFKNLEDLLKRSDVLTLHLPYEKNVHHFIGKKELAIMKSGSFLINASRGGLIDEEALYEALKSGHLGGAALDTFEREPYEGRLHELDNVILTPHIGSYARAGRIQMERQAAENLIAELRRLKLLDGGTSD